MTHDVLNTPVVDDFYKQIADKYDLLPEDAIVTFTGMVHITDQHEKRQALMQLATNISEITLDATKPKVAAQVLDLITVVRRATRGDDKRIFFHCLGNKAEDWLRYHDSKSGHHLNN